MPLPQGFGLDPAAAIAAAQQAASQSAARTQDALQQAGGSDTNSGMTPIGAAATGAASVPSGGGAAPSQGSGGGQAPSVLGRIAFALGNMGTHGALLQQKMSQQYATQRFEQEMKFKTKAAQDQAVTSTWAAMAEKGQIDPNAPSFQKWVKANPDLAAPMLEYSKTQQKLMQGKAALGQLAAQAAGLKNLTPEQQQALAQDPKAAEGLIGIAGKEIDLRGKQIQEQKAEALANAQQAIAGVRFQTAQVELKKAIAEAGKAQGDKAAAAQAKALDALQKARQATIEKFTAKNTDGTPKYDAKAMQAGVDAYNASRKALLKKGLDETDVGPELAFDKGGENKGYIFNRGGDAPSIGVGDIPLPKGEAAAAAPPKDASHKVMKDGKLIGYVVDGKYKPI